MTPLDPVPPVSVTASGDRGVGAGSIGVAITGDGARVVLLPPEAVRWAQEVAAPPHAGYLPGSMAGVFLGRDREVSRLRELLRGGGEAAVTQPQTIHGLGGVGKSTLALHYAHRFRSNYTLAWWITAESQEQINASLAGLAMRLCPQWAGGAGPDERTAWALTWLQWHPGWLLIFDNVEDPDDLRPYLGSLTGGDYLATSRRATGWHAIAPTMSLGVLASDASTDLLCTLALDRPTLSQRRQAMALARELGYLPLALEQAGAYLRQTGTDIESYRRELGLMLSKAADGIDPQRTIARIWDQTLSAITDRDPLAVTLLHSLAWLAPDNIPRTLLVPLAPDRVALDEALGVLHAYSMVTFSGPDVTIHRLLQAVLRNFQAAPGSTPRGRTETERILRTAVYPDGNDEPAPNDRWQHLIPHLIACAFTSPSGSRTDEALSAYQTAADYLKEMGQELRAIPLFQAVLSQHERALGSGHPDTLQSRDHLAGSYYSIGDQRKAIPLYAENLTCRRRVLGESHPETLKNSTMLAHAYRMAGDPERAILLYEGSLSRSVSTLGDHAPDALHICIGLAGAYKWAGDLHRAISLFESTLSKYEQTLGTTHPSTLESRNQLAGAYGAARNFAQAIPLFESTLAQSEQVLGNAHRLTLRLRSNLADACQAEGDVERAIPLFERTLSERERLLGDSHPDTMCSRNYLACAYQAAGDLGRAIPLYEATLAQREQVLGNGHPDTQKSHSNLALARRDANAVERQSTATAPGNEPSPETHE